MLHDFIKAVMHVTEQLSVYTAVEKEKLQNMEYKETKIHYF